MKSFATFAFAAAVLMAGGCSTRHRHGAADTVSNPVRLAIDHAVSAGHSVYVVGDAPILGGSDPVHAVRLVEDEPGKWSLAARFPEASTVTFRYLVRDDGNRRLADPSNAQFLDAVPRTIAMAGEPPSRAKVQPPDLSLSAPRVEKIAAPDGSLSPRAVYVYLPRGYDQQQDERYPVILMHDGNNCFEQYVQDSFVGSWKADQVATRLIDEGRMRPCIIVGVANGGANRIREYLPPWTSFRDVQGSGDTTLSWYFETLLPWLRERYRVADGRENVATVGSSLGGLMALYAAFEYPQHARHHAALSSAIWVTRRGEDPVPMALSRWGAMPKPDCRIWLDSGTLDRPDSVDPQDDDDLKSTRAMRDVLLEKGFVLGEDMMHIVDIGGIHNEASWSGRLDQVLEFLFPADPLPPSASTAR